MQAIGYNVTDYFILATGYTKEHMQAIADKIQEVIASELSMPVDHVEGYNGGWWILLDYMDFVVHTMSEDARNYYLLEQLWGDAPSWRYPEDFYAENSEGKNSADN
jgi:ribosome-associated protein